MPVETHARRHAAAVSLAAAAFGTWAVVGSRWLHPRLTRNADEATYLQQAAALAAGHLSAALPGDARTFQPWFAVVRDGRYVFKYTLVWPAVLAVGRTLGSTRVGLFLAAFVAFVGVYLLAREVLGSHPRAFLAAGLFAVAPLPWFLATTYLPYVWFTGSWTFTAWAILRCARAPRPGFAIAAGLLGGFSFFARPFEAILVLAPFLGWLVWDGRREVGALARRVGWIAVGAVTPIALFLAGNQALTGSPLRTTLTMWDPLDRLGFGPRRIFGSGPAQVDYTLRDGVVSVVKSGALMQLWSAGGVVLLALAIVGLVTAWRRRGVVALAAVAITVPIGFVFYWGPYSMTAIWPRFGLDFGPFYLLPVLVPLSVLAAEGLGVLRHRAPRAVVAAGFLLVVVIAVNQVLALDRNLHARDRRAPHSAAVADLPRGRALVFVPSWAHLLGIGRNGDLVNLSPNPEVLYANTLGRSAMLTTVEAFPDRAPFRIRRTGRTSVLQSLRVASGGALGFAVDVRDTRGAASAVLEVTSGGLVHAVPLTGPRSFVVVVSPEGIAVDGAPVAGVLRPGTPAGTLAFTVRLRGVPDAGDQRYKWVTAQRIDPDGVTVLLPGRTRRSDPAGAGLVRGPVGDVLAVRPG